MFIPNFNLNLTCCLGYGSFGIVVKSENANGSLMAVKIIFKDTPQNNSSLSRECSILSGKEHKNIIKIQSVFEHYFTFEEMDNLAEIVNNEKIYDQLSLKKAVFLKSGVPLQAICIQMELCDYSLRDWLRKNTENALNPGPLDFEQLRIIRDIINGLKYLHENKILHRDLKPENILFCKEPEPTWKIGDFGLSRILHSDASFTASLTKDVGTPVYRAPEMISVYDLRSDLYSLGLIIWEVGQLIPSGNRNNLFRDLVINKNVEAIKAQLVSGISKIIINLTKYDVNKRMNNINGLEKFSAKIEENLKSFTNLNGGQVSYTKNNGHEIQMNPSMRLTSPYLIKRTNVIFFISLIAIFLLILTLILGSKLQIFNPENKPTLISPIKNISGGFQWQTFQNGTWAFGCDFKGLDIGSKSGNYLNCGDLCIAFPGCTHYTWTNWDGGTCWLKGGNGQWREEAVGKNDADSVCGFVDVLGSTTIGPRQISFTNKCGVELWIAFQTINSLSEGSLRLRKENSLTFFIQDEGWSGIFWPKFGCNINGQNCLVGESKSLSADTKVEFNFPEKGSEENVWYDITLVNGYSLPVSVVPNVQNGDCTVTNCLMTMEDCPKDEYDVGDLRAQINGTYKMCLSPCKKWSLPPPGGLGKGENTGYGPDLCCPPPVTPSQCKAGAIKDTWYVRLVKSKCPSAYSYNYDDEAGIHNCPNNAGFAVTFCQ